MPAVLLQGDVFVSSPLTSLAEPCASAILAAQPCEAHPSPVVLYYHPRPFLEPWKDFSSSRRVTSLVAPGPDQPALFDHRWVSVCSCAHRHGLDEADSRSCAGCSLPMDRVGDHALCWAKLGIYVRHNDPETNSQRFASRWIWRWNSINARTIGGPVDVLVHGIKNSPLAVDFSVVHRLQPSASLAEVRVGWKIGPSD